MTPSSGLAPVNDTYRVARWQDIYERNRTREMVDMKWIPVPVDLSGDGFTLTMEQPDGPALYGTFIALLLVAARCEPRGTLVRSNGMPHDAASLKRKTGIPEKAITRALEWFTSKELKWLEIANVRDACGEPAGPSQEAAGCLRYKRGEKNTLQESTALSDSAGELQKKHAYRDQVKMKPAEYQRLVNAHGKWFVERCLDKLDAWKGAKGKKTKSDYKAILNWVVGAINEDIERGRLKPPREAEQRDGKYSGVGEKV